MGYSFRFRKRDNPEGRIVLNILKNLAWNGYFCGKIKVKGVIKAKGGFAYDPYTLRGAPDILAIKDDIILGIEVKAGKNTLTPHQQTFRTHFHNPPNRLYLEVHSWEEVAKALKIPA